MSPAAKVAVGISAYLGVGAIVAVWSAHRNYKGKPGFAGIKGDESPITILGECVVLWPYAAFRNIVPPVELPKTP